MLNVTLGKVHAFIAGICLVLTVAFVATEAVFPMFLTGTAFIINVMLAAIADGDNYNE